MTYSTTRKCCNDIEAIQEEPQEEATEDLLLVEPDNNEEKEVMTLQEVKFIFDRFMKKL